MHRDKAKDTKKKKVCYTATMRQKNFELVFEIFRLRCKLNFIPRHFFSSTGHNLLPCPFTGPKMFWAGPNFLCQTKNLFIYCGSHKHFVPDKKDDLHSVKLVFVPAQKFLKRH